MVVVGTGLAKVDDLRASAILASRGASGCDQRMYFAKFDMLVTENQLSELLWEFNDPFGVLARVWTA